MLGVLQGTVKTLVLGVLQGTLLRTAVALGWDAVYMLPGCCDPFNDKALQAGRGAAFKLPMAEGNWHKLADTLGVHDVEVYGASPDKGQGPAPGTAQTGNKVAVQIPDVTLPLCVILGSEGQGLSEFAIKVSTPLAIPMSGAMESLNVSQAGAILMFALGGRTSQLYSQLVND